MASSNYAVYVLLFWFCDKQNLLSVKQMMLFRLNFSTRIKVRKASFILTIFHFTNDDQNQASEC